MQLGKVVGTVVCNHKVNSLNGLKLLAVAELDPQNNLTGTYVIAVDSVNAGVGDVVLYASGSAARQTADTKDRPADAVIMAIVDMWDIDGELIYKKFQNE